MLKGYCNKKTKMFGLVPFFSIIFVLCLVEQNIYAEVDTMKQLKPLVGKYFCSDLIPVAVVTQKLGKNLYFGNVPQGSRGLPVQVNGSNYIGYVGPLVLKALPKNGFDTNIQFNTFRNVMGCFKVAATKTVKLENGFDSPALVLNELRKKDVERIKKKEALDAKKKLGATTLMLAAEEGDIKTVKRLVNKKTNINAKDKTGATALRYALVADNVEVATFLIDKGADVNAKDNDGESAIMTAIASGDIETVKLLVNKGADVNLEKGKKGPTALMYAVLVNKIDIVNFLIDKGADVNAMTEDGRTAAMIAEMIADKKGRIEIVKLLAEKGANVESKRKVPTEFDL